MSNHTATTKLSCSEVDLWLQHLKLPQYAQLFRQRGLSSVQDCKKLTRIRLEQMGITLPGHVCRMTKAISKLSNLAGSRRRSRSSEEIRQAQAMDESLNGGNYELREAVNLAYLIRSDSNPDVRSSPHPFLSPLDNSSLPVRSCSPTSDYFDLLSVLPHRSQRADPAQFYDVLKLDDKPTFQLGAGEKRTSFNEEMTALDPLTQQQLILTRSQTDVFPVPIPRIVSVPRVISKKNSADSLPISSSHRLPVDRSQYTIIDESQIEEPVLPLMPQHVKKTQPASDYDELSAVSLEPIIMPASCPLSPPPQLDNLPIGTKIALGLKEESSQSQADSNLSLAPIPAPRRSPSSPLLTSIDNTPQIPGRYHSHSHQRNNLTSAQGRISHGNKPTLNHPSLSLKSSSPEPVSNYPDLTSPLEKVNNPVYVPSEDIHRFYSSYTPMRPAPAPPHPLLFMLPSDQMRVDEDSGTSSDDGVEAGDVLVVLSHPKVNASSLPMREFPSPEGPKRCYTTTGLIHGNSPKLPHKFGSSSQIVPSDPISSTPVSTLEGWLYKQGGLRANKGWKKRWVIFDGYELKYFKSEIIKECQGRIPLGTMKEIQTGVETSGNQNGDTSIRMLGRQTRFVLVTLSRSYYFHVATETDFRRWVNTLQTAISNYKPNAEAMAEGGTMNDPDKTGIVLKQGHNLHKDWKPRFCALKDTRLAYYYSEEDFKVGNPINTINMRLAAVRPKPGPDGQPRFEIVIVGGRNYVFECRELSELQIWVDALTLSVLQALTLFDQGKGQDQKSAQDILTTLYTNSSNQQCADCQATNPSWVSLNLCVLVCIECSGVHRALGAHLSKVRSVDLDKTVWTAALIELLICLGNEEVNKLYLDRYHGEKMFSDEQYDIRKNFISAKYKDKAWLKKGARGSVVEVSPDEQTELNQSLCETALDGTLFETLHLLLQGADPTYSEPVPRIPGEPASTPLQLTKAAERPLHHELLTQWRWRVQEDRESFTSTIERSHLSGYLHKYSPATTRHGKPQLRPTWQKRFFVLRQEGLSILKSDRDLDPEGEILASEILLVKETKDLPEPQDGKFPHVFELISSKPAIYAFSAPTRSDMELWLNKLTNILNPDVFQLHGMDRWGYLRIRTNQTSPWKQRFCFLKSRMLVALSLDRAEPEKIHLQSSLSIQPPADPDTCQTKELSVCFQIITQEKTYSIHTNSHHEAKLWYQVLKRTQVFGVPLEEQQCTSAGVPLLMHKCIEFIEDDGVDLLGLYRVNGRAKQIDDLILQFDQDCKALVLNPETFSVQDVSGVLKRFLRALPQPLLTKELYPDFMAATSIREHDELMYTIQELVVKMPREYKNTLLRLCEHLRLVAEQEEINKMGVHNLALVFGPNIRGADRSNQQDDVALLRDTEKEVKLMQLLIQHYEWLFEVKNDKDQKKKMEEAIVKMKTAEEQTKKNTLSRVESNDFIITVFIEDKHGEPMTMKVNIKTTALKTFNQCLHKKSMTMDNLALYEILGNNESERVLHPEEQILKVVSSWSNRNNYLCIKINSVVRRICDFTASGTDRVSLYMKGKNRWKKHIFWVNGEWLFSQKEGKGIFAREGPQTTKLDFVLFIGLLQSDISRNSPTQWGFWLQRSYDDAHRYLCADTEQDMYRFIACFYHAKYHPAGLNSLTYTPPCDSTLAGNLSPRRLYPQVKISKHFSQSNNFAPSSEFV